MSWTDEQGGPELRPSRAQLERLLDGRAGRPDALFSAPRRRRRIRILGPKIAVAKLLTIGGVAVAATGGVAATAASIGHLPNPLPHSSHGSKAAVAALGHSRHPNRTSPSGSAVATRPATRPASATTSGSTAAPGSASPVPSGTQPAGTPTPSLRGLCQSWLSRPHQHGKADTNPAFSALVTAAGGADAVTGYCTALLSAAPDRPTPTISATPISSVKPAMPSHSQGKPSTMPGSSHGKPTAVSSHSHPTGH